MVSVVTQSSEISFDQGFEVFSPVDTQFQVLSDESLEKYSNKAVILKTLINPFSTNDIEGGDEISLSIYSDVIGEMFKCGTYEFLNGDMVDFHDLVVPCEEFITVTISEQDGT